MTATETELGVRKDESGKEKGLECISSDTFKPTGQTLGMGCWGKVKEYLDPVGQRWALKTFNPDDTALRQMRDRGWTEEDVMRNEAISLDAAQHHVVPRIIERDKKGKLYVGMPVYHGGNLAGRIYELRQDYELNRNATTLLTIVRDTADALGFMHGRFFPFQFQRNIKTRRAHGDVKPSNILIEAGRAYLADLGSSACVSIGGNGVVRGEHGDVNYRAPECFSPTARPSERADVWSLGAIAYNLFVKDGIYSEIDRENLSEKDLQKQINRKIRNAPRVLRKFLKKCLSVDPGRRYLNGQEAFNGIEKVIDNWSGWRSFVRYSKWTAAALGVASIFTFGGYKAATHEPIELTIPEPQRLQGVLYKPGEEPEGMINFEYENMPYEDPPRGMLISGKADLAKKVTDNRVVAYLVKCHAQAAQCNIRSIYSDYQMNIYRQYTHRDELFEIKGRAGNLEYGNPWLVWAKSIEVALGQGRTRDGKIDLEDVMAITRVGPEKVMQAKRIARSEDFRNYCSAKDEKGEYVIPEREQDFVKTWLAYYHTDVD